MSEVKVWATSEDGTIEYVSLTKDLLQQAIEAMQQSFYLNENICVAFDMLHQPESFPEMDGLLLRSAIDGVSIVAVDKATKKVAGAAFNKLEEPGDSTTFYTEYLKSCKHSASRGVTQWMMDIEDMFDIFDQCKVNGAFEVMFLGIIPEFRKRGIAKKLFEVSIEVAKALNQGQNVRVPITNEKLEEMKNPPQIVTAICTSFITQKIASGLGFVPAFKVEFNKFVYDGKDLGSIIGNKTPFITYEYIKI